MLDTVLAPESALTSIVSLARTAIPFTIESIVLHGRNITHHCPLDMTPRYQ
jgi:hypothetical protein